MSIIARSFLVLLCGGGASLDTISFQENISEEVIVELNDEKEPIKGREFQTGPWDIHAVVLRMTAPTIAHCVRREWQKHIGPCKPEWEFRL